MSLIREYTQGDEQAVAQVCFQAFWDDVLVGNLMHPHRHDFPDDFLAFFDRRIQKSDADPSHRHFVAVTIDAHTGKETVVGYADWVRQGQGRDDAAPAAATTFDAAISNRAADPREIDVYERAAIFSKHYWSGDRAETWLLDLLAVDPSYQRQGHGRALVIDGLKLMEADDVCASVVASPQGDGLYMSCGFEPVGYVTEGEGNPLKDLPGGRIMFRDRRNGKA